MENHGWKAFLKSPFVESSPSKRLLMMSFLYKITCPLLEKAVPNTSESSFERKTLAGKASSPHRKCSEQQTEKWKFSDTITIELTN